MQPDEFELMIITLLPVDVSRLPVPDGAEIPRPSIEHSLTTCDVCGDDCWIGPHQLIEKKRTGNPGICYYCVLPHIAAQQRTGIDVEVRGLDPNADAKPRRT